MKAAITSALSNQWLQNYMDLVHESYAINFMDPEASVRNMEVLLSSEGTNGKLAYVTNTYDSSTGKTNKLTLTVNMSYYNNINMKDPNGYDKTSRQTYLDRVIAHEMTHALMAANIDHFSDLPAYIKEGTAELVHGIDDQRKEVIKDLAENNDDLKDALNWKPANPNDSPGEKVYAAGYMALRYLAHQSANAAPQKRLVFQIGTKANVLLQTAQSMLAQANQNGSSVLGLLQ